MESKKIEISKSNAEPEFEKFPPHVLEEIERSLQQYENGQYISWEEFKRRHFTKLDRKA